LERILPIYDYRCSSCGFQKEYLRKVSDPLLSVCPECSEETFAKMLTAAGFHLKGGGWYATDFKNSGAKPVAKGADQSATEGKSTGETATAGESKGERKNEGKGDGKSESKTESKSDGKSGGKSEGKTVVTAATTAATSTAKAQ
jgi:putative FmdB family regulatory protein